MVLLKMLLGFRLITLMQRGNYGGCRLIIGDHSKKMATDGGLSAFHTIARCLIGYGLIILGHFLPIGKFPLKKLPPRMDVGQQALVRIFLIK
ncbi:hypothetical protein D3C73_1109760 [compost metagenome]